MSNKTFFQQASQDASKITWKDVFSEYKVKHTRRDLEYALLAGTSLDTASDETMLQKWHKPWIFYPILKGGIALIVIIYVLLFGTLFLSGSLVTSLAQMAQIIPPLVAPLILLVFFWEMNIPRNISIYEVLGMFLLGGLISFAITSFMFLAVPDGLPANYAPLREEPAKLAAAVILLWVFGKKRKVYGITGLVIGAAVGAGFGAFESMSYAIDQGSLPDMVVNQLLRGVFALGGHTLYCAPYAAAVALEMKDDRLGGDCFTNSTFLSAFLISCGLHFLWNTQVSYVPLIEYGKDIAIIAVLWMQMLRIMQKCLHQITRAGGYREEFSDSEYTANHSVLPRPATGSRIRVRCLWGGGQETVWGSDEAGAFVIGRETACRLKFPDGAKGVSRRHCSIQYTNFGWTVRDLNSTYGTYLNQNLKLLPGTELPLHSGDRIYVGGPGYVLEVTIS